MTAITEFVRMAVWEMKRALFTEAEKQILNNHICGQVICPRGVVVVVNDQTLPILERLR